MAHGDPIIELDAALARADLAEREASRDALKSALDLLVTPPRAEDRKVQELAVEQARVALERAHAVVERLGPLRAKGEISQQQMFDAEQALALAKLQQQSAEAQLNLLVVGPRPEAIAEAKAKLASAEQAVARTKEQLEQATIRSPIDGVLDSLLCHLGQTVPIATPIGEVVNSDQVYATVWLPPQSAASVHRGQVAEVRASDARARRPTVGKVGEEWAAAAGAIRGTVEFVGRVVDPQSGNLPVRILVDNAGGQLAIGQTVAVSIVIQNEAGMLVVPASAVSDVGEGPVVNVVRDGVSVPLHPESTIRDRGWIVIVGTDLEPGEPVITAGGFNLPEGTKVKVKAPATKSHAAAQSESPDAAENDS